MLPKVRAEGNGVSVRRGQKEVPITSGLTKDPAYSAAVDGYESRPPRPSATPPCQGGESTETRNKQQLMSNSIAPYIETYQVSTQKSADGIVPNPAIGIGRPLFEPQKCAF